MILTCGLVSLLDLLGITFHQEIVEVGIAQKSLPEGEYYNVCNALIFNLFASSMSVECLML